MKLFQKFLTLTISLVIAIPISFSVSAQDSTPTLGIEEIIVTARKKDESIQDVPMAVTAITEQLRESSVRRIEDIQAFAPNLFINRTPGIASGAAITIRGIASLESDKSYEPAIGVVMDGMFLGTSSGVLLDNFDIERIEVLRGPQGTLFGKNTIAGAINITTAQPTDEFEGYISAGYTTELEAKTLTTVISGPLSDTVRGRLAIRSYEDEGYVKNLTESGVDGPQNDSLYVRGTLAIDLNEDWTATFKAEHGKYDVLGRQEVIAQVNPRLGPAVGLYGSPFSATNFEAGFDYKNYQQKLEIKWAT